VKFVKLGETIGAVIILPGSSLIHYATPTIYLINLYQVYGIMCHILCIH